MQKKNSFDKETTSKIWKGFLIAGGGAGIVYILEFVQTLEFNTLTPLVVALCSVGINIIREYLKGK
jgi:hypothetical protein